MKLKEFIANCQKIIDENPDAADFEVIYAADDEGNRFSALHYNPTLCRYDEGGVKIEADDPNAVIIN